MIKCSEELKALLLTGGYLNEEVEIVIKKKDEFTLTFTDRDVKVGGLSWSKEASDTVGFELGWCDTTEVELELLRQVKEDIYESTLEIYYTYTLPSMIKETYKVGTYYIPKGNVILGIDSTKVTAFSSTAKLKKKIEVGVEGSLYDLLDWACRACDVSLGMTEAELNALSPATKYAYVVDLKTSIKNYSDVVMWISQVLGGFVDCDVNGALVINTFNKSFNNDFSQPVSDPDWRYGLGYVKEPELGSVSYIVSDVKVQVGDFVNYTSEPIQVKDNYFNSVGYEYVIDNNPILQVIQLEKTQFEDIHNGMINNLKYCNFREMENFILDNPFFELGDVVFSTNSEGMELASCITRFKYTYNGNATLSCCPMSDLYTQEKQSTQSASTTGGGDVTSAVLKVLRTALVKDTYVTDYWEKVVSLDIKVNNGINPIFTFVDCVKINQGGTLKARLRYDGYYLETVLENDIYKFRDEQKMAVMFQWVLPEAEVAAVHSIILEVKYEKYDSTTGGYGAVLEQSSWGSYIMASGVVKAGGAWTGIFEVTDNLALTIKPLKLFGEKIEELVKVKIGKHAYSSKVADEVNLDNREPLLGVVSENAFEVGLGEHLDGGSVISDRVNLGQVSDLLGMIADTVGSSLL